MNFKRCFIIVLLMAVSTSAKKNKLKKLEKAVNQLVEEVEVLKNHYTAEPDCLSLGNGTYTYAHGKCLYVEMALFNYTEAMVNCQNRFGSKNTGKLFEPRNPVTDDQIINFAKRMISSSTTWLHIGINDIATEGTWQYAIGGDLAYTNWGNGQPSNGGANGEDCGETWNSGTTWNDGLCSHKQASICEMI